LLISFFPKNAGEYALYDLKNTLILLPLPLRVSCYLRDGACYCPPPPKKLLNYKKNKSQPSLKSINLPFKI
jgi:hypothetical protein